MKYVHDGKTYIIFSVYEGLGHSDISIFINSFQPVHAGFLVFKNEEKSKEAEVYRSSTGLGLKSQPFDYDEINYVGISPRDFVIISNSKENLKLLGCTDIEIATWKESREGNYGECPVIYPGHSTINMRACQLNRH